MVLSIVVIVLVGVIAFYHLTEGFFSALISAISAVLAAVLAVSYTEPLVSKVFHANLADSNYSMTLVILFIVAYSIIRTLIDKMVPGNVRTPATLDKVFGALMGLVAGTFAVGIFVIALQMLPFGATISIFGYNRFDVTGQRAVYVRAGSNKPNMDSFVYNQLKNDSLVEDESSNKPIKLWLPADDLVLNTVYRLSDGGSLAGTRTLASVHPDWLSELFGERIGQQTGSRRVALIQPGSEPITVPAAFSGAGLPTFDGYGQAKRNDPPDLDIRPMGFKFPYGEALSASKGGLFPLVLRVKVRTSAIDDADHIFRFSPGQVRLVVRSEPNADGEYRDAKSYYPIGFMDQGKVVLNRVDDFLFLNTAEAGGFDAVFMVDKNTALVAGKKSNEIAPGTFLSVKRTANIDLAGLAVGETLAKDDSQKLLRTDALLEELHPEPKN